MKFVGVLLVWALTLGALSSETVLKTEFQDTQPKYILGTDGKFSGLALELLAIIEKTSEFRFTYPSFYVPIARINSDLAAGAIDVYLGLAKTPQREKDFEFVAKMFSTRYQILARKDDALSRISTLEQLVSSQVPIMVIRGGAPENYYKSIPGLTLTQAPNGLEASLLQLKAGNARLFGYYDLGNDWAIDSLKLRDVVAALPLVLASDDQWFCVSRSVPRAVVEKVTKAISEAQKSREWAAVLKKYFPAD